MISTEAMIILTVSILVAGIVGTAVIGFGDEISESIESLGEDVSNDMREDIKIVSDIGSGQIYDKNNDVITVQVQNTGSTTIEKDSIILQIDGKIFDVSSITIDDGSRWSKGRVAIIEANASLSGNTRVTVRTVGSEDTINFFAG